MSEKKPEQYSFYRRLFALVLPMAAQNLLNALLSASNALMPGFITAEELKNAFRA